MGLGADTRQTHSSRRFWIMQTLTRVPTLRDLRVTDVASIVALAGPLGSTEGAAEWRRRLRRGSGVVAIGAEEDGRLVGYAAGSVRAAFGLRPTGWVEAFGVDNAWRGRGLGRRVAEALLVRFKELGAERAATVLPLHDRVLAPFFRDLGFREDSLVTLGRTI